MKASLEERFKEFMHTFVQCECIDKIELPSIDREVNRGKPPKIADYFTRNRRAIVELKALKVDPAYKVDKEMRKHRQRDDFPVFYWEEQVSTVLEHLPDGELIKSKIFNTVTLRIKEIVRSANKQISSTKKVFSCLDAFGILVVLNESIEVLRPELLLTRFNRMLVKKNSNGKYHYQHVNVVWAIFENHFVSTSDGTQQIPSLMLYSPTRHQERDLHTICDNLQKSWAEFNGIPFIAADNYDTSQLKTVTKNECKTRVDKPRTNQDVMQEKYRQRPYLRSLSDEAVLLHGAKLRDAMGRAMTNKNKRLPKERLFEFMIGMNDFIEECKFRHLNLRGMPPIQGADLELDQEI